MADMPETLKVRLPGGFSIPPFGIHQVLALMIVAIALWVIGTVWLGVQGARQWVGSWQDSLQIHVYLERGQSQRLEALQQGLASLPAVRKVDVISDQKMQGWMQDWLSTSQADVQDFAARLPITLALELNLRELQEGRFALADVRDEAVRHGAEVNEGEMQLAKANETVDTMQKLVWMVTVLLALSMALIVSNTLRMILLARADEVRLMRLLGAKEWFVRMPFVLEGLLLGAGAGLLAWLLLWPLVLVTMSWVESLQIDLQVWIQLPMLVLAGALSGLMGSLIATFQLGDSEAREDA